MRVLMICWEYPPHSSGGLGRHVTGLLAAMGALTPETSVQVDLLTPRYAGGAGVESIGACVTVYRLDMPLIEKDHYVGVTDNNATFVRHATKLARQHLYDLIHVQDWLSATAGLELKAQWQVPLVATVHTTTRGVLQAGFRREIDSRIEQLEQQLCSVADRIIVCSRFMRQEVQNVLAVSPHKICVIFNGVKERIEEGCTEEEIKALRQRYSTAGQPLLMFAGSANFRIEKGLFVLLRALPRILDHYPGTRLLILGEYSQHFETLVYELRIEKAVAFLGFVSDYVRDCLYRTVDAIAIPSLYEPFGIVALEAMALGCNVIASDVGGLSEVVSHEETGLLVPPGDPIRLAHAVEQVVADPAAAQRRRLRALQIIEQRFRWAGSAAQTLALYRSLIPGSSQPGE